MKSFALSAVVLALLAGCSSSTPPAQVENRGNDANTNTNQVRNDGAANRNPLTDPNNILSKRSVFFDYDSYVVKEQFKPLVDAHARYLMANPNRRILLQGHADERGSREYNLALGQKRAEAVRKVVTLIGAPDARVEAVSMGEEKPRNPGHDEAAYAENRRVDIVYDGE